MFFNLKRSRWSLARSCHLFTKLIRSGPVRLDRVFMITHSMASPYRWTDGRSDERMCVLRPCCSSLLRKDMNHLKLNMLPQQQQHQQQSLSWLKCHFGVGSEKSQFSRVRSLASNMRLSLCLKQNIQIFAIKCVLNDPKLHSLSLSVFMFGCGCGDGEKTSFRAYMLSRSKEIRSKLN